MREHAGEALALAHFMDETWEQRPARRIEASPWYEAAGALAARLLGQHTRAAPKVHPKTHPTPLHPSLNVALAVAPGGPAAWPLWPTSCFPATCWNYRCTLGVGDLVPWCIRVHRPSRAIVLSLGWPRI